MGKKRCTGIVLAAGSGKRMKSEVAKQFLPLAGKPLLWYSLQAMEQSEIIDDVILVAGMQDIGYVKREIVEAYHFRKVAIVTAGGEERYHSVYRALCALKEGGLQPDGDGYVFIHDGARPFVTEEILRGLYETVQKSHACVTATRVKDTIKVCDEQGIVLQTPSRDTLWSVQTPQVFDTALIVEAYQELMRKLPCLSEQGTRITDDAMVVETLLRHKIQLVEGSYRNIKITTPEDMMLGEIILKSGL